MSGVDVATMIRSIVVGREARGVQRRARSRGAEIAGGLVIGCEMARADAGAL